jgi:hypothetical protein
MHSSSAVSLENVQKQHVCHARKHNEETSPAGRSFVEMLEYYQQQSSLARNACETNK